MSPEEYFEEVDKFVDGIVEDIRAGHITDRRSARLRVKNQSTIYGVELYCAALLFGNFPSVGIGKIPRTRESDLEFPFKLVGAPVFLQDTLDSLASRPEYRLLQTAQPKAPPGKTKPAALNTFEAKEDEDEDEELPQ